MSFENVYVENLVIEKISKTPPKYNGLRYASAIAGDHNQEICCFIRDCTFSISSLQFICSLVIRLTFSGLFSPFHSYAFKLLLTPVESTNGVRNGSPSKRSAIVAAGPRWGDLLRSLSVSMKTVIRLSRYSFACIRYSRLMEVAPGDDSRRITSFDEGPSCTSAGKMWPRRLMK